MNYKTLTLTVEDRIYDAVEGLHQELMKLNPKETPSIGDFAAKLMMVGGQMVEQGLKLRKEHIVVPENSGLVGADGKPLKTIGQNTD